MTSSSVALFGTETEYAITAVGGDGRLLPVGDIADELLVRAAARPSLWGAEPGLFLSNGARLYIDGSHPEYASPETTDPWNAVRYALAGDQLLRELAEEIARDDPRVARLLVSKGNVGYVGPATWASHENYLHRRPPGGLRPALIPHLVSRIVFTGAGGFDPFNASHASFVVSPRALFVHQLMGASALGSIALVDDRTQPHCTGFHRQHLMCGDANRSQLSMFLRMATTALVVGLIDAGWGAEEEVTLADPLEALATVARDHTLRERLALMSGRQMTALEIQRHLLRTARQHRGLLPAWADAACNIWQDTLDRLAKGPDAVADRLDWAIKREICRGWRAGRDGQVRPLINWRAELCEIDLLFGQIYPSSLFDRLDEAGVLRHRLTGVGPEDLAVSSPPTAGRARIRGEVVRRLAEVAPGAICCWSGIWDFSSRRVLDLESPFADTEVWRDLSQERPATPSLIPRLLALSTSRPSPAITRAIRALVETLCAEMAHTERRWSGDSAIQLNNCAFSARNAGRLEDAEWLMRGALAIDLAVGTETRRKLAHRRNNLATVLLMQGRTAEARYELALAWNEIGTQYDLTSARVLTMRFAAALAGREPTDLLVGQLKSHFAIRPLPDFADVDRRWQLPWVLDALASRVDGEALDLLRAIGELANGARQLDSLQDMPLWRDSPPVALDAVWPALASDESRAVPIDFVEPPSVIRAP